MSGLFGGRVAPNRGGEYTRRARAMLAFVRARHRPALSWRLDCPVCGATVLAGDDRDYDASVFAGIFVGAALELLAASIGLR